MSDFLNVYFFKSISINTIVYMHNMDSQSITNNLRLQSFIADVQGVSDMWVERGRDVGDREKVVGQVRGGADEQR